MANRIANPKISICYIGDVRGNHDVMIANHSSLITKLREHFELEIIDFTKKSKIRKDNPYDRMKMSGAIQVLDFIHSIEVATGNIVLKLRTDVWFTKKAIDIILVCIKKIINDESDSFYLGSDIMHGGHIMDGWEGRITVDTNTISDYLFIARKDVIRSKDQILQQLIDLPESIGDGNRTFLFLIKDLGNIYARARVILTHIWLIRKYYNDYPDDWVVFCDYAQRYIRSEKMQLTIDWYRSQRGWNPMKIDLQDLTRWQTE